MSAATYQKIAELFPGRWDRNYAAAKLRTDPLYMAVGVHLRHSKLPLLDLGCGLGLLAFFLRSRGIDAPIHCLDYDLRKIQIAKYATNQAGLEDVSFAHHDARDGLPDHHGNVSILDILQFFKPEEQKSLLILAALRVAPGGKLIIRSGLRDTSFRFKITVLGDWLAKATFWMKAAPTHYPTAVDFKNILSAYGTVSVDPLWGRTPFNNHLIVMTRSE